MQFDYESDVALYLQVAEQLENGILSGAFPEEEQIPSTTEISVSYKINPATVLKGVTMLAEQNLLYKKRGIGMFVSAGARARLRQKRREGFLKGYVEGLLAEAKKLEINEEELIEMIRLAGKGGQYE